MKKIKWRNVFKLIVLAVATCMLAYLSYHLTFYTLFTGKSCGLTLTGLVMFGVSCLVIEYITDDFKDQTKKVSNARNIRYQK